MAERFEEIQDLYRRQRELRETARQRGAERGEKPSERERMERENPYYPSGRVRGWVRSSTR